MGKVLSKDLAWIYKLEDQKKFLLKLVTECFYDCRKAVEEDRDLQENFRMITHYPVGKFFASPHEAVGYLKEDVFFSNDRTDRVFRIIASFYRGDLQDWKRSRDSDSDECENHRRKIRANDSMETEDESKDYSTKKQIFGKKLLQNQPKNELVNQNDFKAQLAQLKKEYDDKTDSLITKLAKHEEEVRKKELDIQYLQRKHEAVNGELAQLKNAMAEVQYNKEEFNRLEGKYKELQGKYGEELDAKHKIEKEKFAAEHKLKDLTDEVERSKTTEHQANYEKNEVEGEKKNLEEKNKLLRNELDQTKRELQREQDTNRARAQVLHQLKNIVREQKFHSSSSKSYVIDAQEQTQMLFNEVVMADDFSAGLIELTKDLTSQVYALKMSCENNFSALQKKKSAAEEQKKKLQKRRNSIDEKKTRLLRLQDFVAELKTDLVSRLPLLDALEFNSLSFNQDWPKKDAQDIQDSIERELVSLYRTLLERLGKERQKAELTITDLKEQFTNFTQDAQNNQARLEQLDQLQKDYTNQFRTEKQISEANQEALIAKHKEEVQKKEQDIKELQTQHKVEKQDLNERLQFAKNDFKRKEDAYDELDKKYAELKKERDVVQEAKIKIELEKLAAEQRLKEFTDEVERSKTTELYANYEKNEAEGEKKNLEAKNKNLTDKLDQTKRELQREQDTNSLHGKLLAMIKYIVGQKDFHSSSSQQYLEDAKEETSWLFNQVTAADQFSKELLELVKDLTTQVHALKKSCEGNFTVLNETKVTVEQHEKKLVKRRSSIDEKKTRLQKLQALVAALKIDSDSRLKLLDEEQFNSQSFNYDWKQLNAWETQDSPDRELISLYRALFERLGQDRQKADNLRTKTELEVDNLNVQLANAKNNAFEKQTLLQQLDQLVFLMQQHFGNHFPYQTSRSPSATEVWEIQLIAQTDAWKKMYQGDCSEKLSKLYSDLATRFGLEQQQLVKSRKEVAECQKEIAGYKDLVQYQVKKLGEADDKLKAKEAECDQVIKTISSLSNKWTQSYSRELQALSQAVNQEDRTKAGDWLRNHFTYGPNEPLQTLQENQMAAVFACIRMQENSKVRNDLIQSYNKCLKDVRKAQEPQKKQGGILNSLGFGKKNDQPPSQTPQEVIDNWECEQKYRGNNVEQFQELFTLQKQHLQEFIKSTANQQEQEIKLTRLESQLQENKAELSTTRNQLAEKNTDLQTVQKKLSTYETLMTKLAKLGYYQQPQEMGQGDSEQDEEESKTLYRPEKGLGLGDYSEQLAISRRKYIINAEDLEELTAKHQGEMKAAQQSLLEQKLKLEDSKQEHRITKGNLERREQDCRELKAQIERLYEQQKQDNNDKVGLRDENYTLKKDIDSLRSEIEVLSRLKKIEDYNKNEEMKTELDLQMTKSQLGTTQRQLWDAEKENKQLTNDLGECKQQLQKLSSSFSEKVEKLKKFEEENNFIKECNQHYSKQIDFIREFETRWRETREYFIRNPAIKESRTEKITAADELMSKKNCQGTFDAFNQWVREAKSEYQGFAIADLVELSEKDIETQFVNTKDEKDRKVALDKHEKELDDISLRLSEQWNEFQVKQNYFGDVKACNSNKRELKDCKQTQERMNLIFRQMKRRISELVSPQSSSKSGAKSVSDKPLMSGTATIEEKLAKTSESLSWLLTTIELMTKTNSKQQGILNMLPDKVDSMTMDIKNHVACIKSIEKTQDVIREARDELARLQIALVVQAQPLKTQEQKSSTSKLTTKTTTSTSTFLTSTTKTAAKIDQKQQKE